MDFAEITGDVAMPTVAAVKQPEVSVTATYSTGKTVNSDFEDGNHRLNCWCARVGEVITVAPIETQLWVQVGFYAQANASNVLAKIEAGHRPGITG